MGVDAHYVMSYRSGLLHRILQLVTQGNHYKIEKADVKYFVLDRKRKTVRIELYDTADWSSGKILGSALTLYYELGYLEVYDLTRYFRNEEYHEKVVKWYSDSLDCDVTVYDDDAHWTEFVLRQREEDCVIAEDVVREFRDACEKAGLDVPELHER